MKQASNAVVLLILVVVIAVVAAPLLTGDVSPSASAEETTGVFRTIPNRASATLERSGHRSGEWTMLLVGSALVVIGAALRRPDSVRASALHGDAAGPGHTARLARRLQGRAAGGRPRRKRTDAASERGGRNAAVRSRRGPER